MHKDFKSTIKKSDLAGLHLSKYFALKGLMDFWFRLEEQVRRFEESDLG